LPNAGCRLRSSMTSADDCEVEGLLSHCLDAVRKSALLVGHPVYH